MTDFSGFRFSVSLTILIGALFLFSLQPALAAEAELPATVKNVLAKAAASATPATTKPDAPATPPAHIETIDEAELEDAEPLPEPEVQDSQEIEPLRVTLDKPEIIRLDRDAVNVIVGSNENLRVVPDTNKTLLLIAKKPGSTYFRALDADGKVIMQRHVLIRSPSKNYIRIRRACANGQQGCKQYSVYYCPDMCHEVNVVQDASGPSAPVPEETPAGQSTLQVSGGLSDDSASATPVTTEPPPGE